MQEIIDGFPNISFDQKERKELTKTVETEKFIPSYVNFDKIGASFLPAVHRCGTKCQTPLP